MQIAALYDIHGNLPALEAVLAEVRREGVDLVVVGGDVLPGPMPRETLACLLDLELPTRFLRGNGDREVLERIRGEETGAVPEAFRELLRWSAKQLPREAEAELASWPLTLSLEVSGLGEVLFCHATPRSDTEVFTRQTPDERLLALFAGVEAPIVVCGHTHMQLDRTVGALRLLNAGSVGMPFGEPGAHWLLLGPDVEFRRTTYDREKAAELIRSTSYPDAQQFALKNVLAPPSEAEMLAVLAPADSR